MQDWSLRIMCGPKSIEKVFLDSCLASEGKGSLKEFGGERKKKGKKKAHPLILPLKTSIPRYFPYYNIMKPISQECLSKISSFLLSSLLLSSVFFIFFLIREFSFLFFFLFSFPFFYHSLLLKLTFEFVFFFFLGRAFLWGLLLEFFISKYIRLVFKNWSLSRESPFLFLLLKPQVTTENQNDFTCFYEKILAKGNDL